MSNGEQEHANSSSLDNMQKIMEGVRLKVLFSETLVGH